ncbi:MAG: cyclic-di-AMP receptor [Defluviitaleaceae bacterium]|nr:cyclic-di-AMP receptor [Defluviitaleaceae bacterium]
MKFIMAIIQDEDAIQIIDMLSERGFKVTKMASTGGFLRAGNTTLICGVEDDKVEEFIGIVEKKCKSRKQITSINSAHLSTSENYVPYPVEVTVGGATVFVLDVADFRRV